MAYAAVNWLPFDSYTIAWERRQLLYFALYYLALALPSVVPPPAVAMQAYSRAARSPARIAGSPDCRCLVPSREDK